MTVPSGERVRAFLALPLDASLRARVQELIATLSPRARGVRFVRPEGLHLTLRFLGDSPLDALDRMRPALAEAASRCPPVEARVAELGTFPERGAPRVLWLGVELPPPALALQAACESAAVANGFAAEPRAFRSHLTLGRWRERAPRPSLPAADLGVARLDQLVLFRSELRPQGALHTPIASFPLGAS